MSEIAGPDPSSSRPVPDEVEDEDEDQVGKDPLTPQVAGASSRCDHRRSVPRGAAVPPCPVCERREFARQIRRAELPAVRERLLGTFQRQYADLYGRKAS